MEYINLLNKITAVDDDPFFLHFIEDKFQEIGVSNVNLFSDPSLGLESLIVNSEFSDLVLVDLQMPEIDGIAFLKLLGDAGYKGQVIVISGFESKVLHMAESIAKQRNLAILGQLTKPFSAVQLNGLVDRALSRILAAENSELAATVGNYNPDEFEISDESLCPVIQPQVCLDNESIIGYEILSRLKSSDGSIIYPSQFISDFEENGRISEFNNVLFRSSLARMAKYENINFSMNLSMRDLNSHRIVDDIDSLLNEFGVQANRLTIEITETCLVENLLTAQEIATRLRLLGCSLAIDDYGTGYSTMKQLTEFPFRELKIDRQYISNCHNHEENQIIIRSTVEMAKALGMKTVAEGVETKQELDFVRQAGIEIVQGYYYSKPYVWA
jgi:EAL domain-containing protein (putative c-di-GMP-specific phosphodiesterase class I)/ActR/RegA family two-component response regulator